MDRVRKIWKFEIKESTLRSVKYRAVKLLGWFLAIMASLTIISRMADSMTIATVSTVTPSRSTISHRTEVPGILAASGGKPVLLPSGVLITELAVRNGDKVAAGDLLLTYDISEFQKQIASAELDVQGIQAQIAELDREDQKQQEQYQTSLERKGDDLETVEKEYDLRLEGLSRELHIARMAFSKYDQIHRQSDYDDIEYTEEEYNQLLGTYRSLQNQYEQLKMERDKSLENVQREIDDLAESSNRSAREMRQLDLRKAQLELSQLYSSVADKGEVYASSDGIVSDLKVELGDISSSGSSLFLREEQGLEFKGTVSEDVRKHLSLGDMVRLKLYGQDTEYKNLPITAIETSPDDPQSYEITVDTLDNKFTLGTGANITITRTSETYDMCVPLSALYYDGQQAYVLTIEEKETTLGTEQIARRVDVIVQESNENTAAIRGALYWEEPVIASADKPVADGSRIRTTDTNSRAGW